MIKKRDKKVLFKELSKNPINLSLYPIEIRESRDIVLDIIEKNEHCIFSVGQKLKENIGFWKQAVLKNKKVLEFLPEKFLKKKWFIEQCLENESPSIIKLGRVKGFGLRQAVFLINQMIINKKYNHLIGFFLNFKNKKLYKEKELRVVLEHAKPKEIYLIWDRWCEKFCKNSTRNWRESGIEDKKKEMLDWLSEEIMKKEKSLLEKILPHNEKKKRQRIL